MANSIGYGGNGEVANLDGCLLDGSSGMDRRVIFEKRHNQYR